MIRTFAVAVVCFAVLGFPRISDANSVEAGDWLRFTGSLGTLGGGAFYVDDLTDPAVADFLTFCVQKTQYLAYGPDFRVGSITTYADDAGGFDYLETETAWIMSSFSRGLLGAYSSNDIQSSIWQLEGEQSGNWGNSGAVIALAQAAVLGGWTNDGVRILNLFWADGTAAQDQLVYLPIGAGEATAAPEPSTLLLLGGGVIAAVAMHRRRAQRG